MSANESQNFTTSITSNTISPPSSPQTNSNELKSPNNEVDDKVQKMQQSSQDEDEEDLSDLANGGWEDDFTDNEDDDERMKEWETLEFLCQISKTRSDKNSSIDGSPKNDDENGDDDENGIVVKKNRKEKNVKDSESDEIKPDKSSNNVEQPLLNENRKRRASENDNEIDVSTPPQKIKKSKDDGLKNLEDPIDS